MIEEYNRGISLLQILKQSDKKELFLGIAFSNYTIKQFLMREEYNRGISLLQILKQSDTTGKKQSDTTGKKKGDLE